MSIFFENAGSWQDVLSIVSFLFGGMIAVILAILLPVFAFLLPDKLLDRYLKQPWFNSGECILYRHFPGRVAFFVNVARSICFPKFGAKARPNMVDIDQHVGVWVKICAWFFIINLGLGTLCLLWMVGSELPTILREEF